MQRTIATIAALLTITLAGCASEATTPFEPSTDLPPPIEPPATNVTIPELAPGSGMRFVVIGDQGTGKEGQFIIAEAIEKVCAERGCDFALALGDNIYEIGVEDEYDPQFEEKFEQPYANLTFPIYMTLGNHDNSHDPVTPLTGEDAGIGHWYESGDYEVAYHYRTDRSSEKWQMPARYYDFTLGNTTFFSLDTNTLMYLGQGITTDVTIMEQEAWIDEALATADTPWKIAFGHHPYRSNGEHGDAGDYDQYTPAPPEPIPNPNPISGQYMEMFFEEHVCNQVDIYFSGHDHDLQWLAPTDACDETELIVSGAAAKTRSAGDEERNEARFQRFDGLGFMVAEIDGDTFTGSFYDENAGLLYEGSFTRS